MPIPRLELNGFVFLIKGQFTIEFYISIGQNFFKKKFKKISEKIYKK
jgi:hypothetical protein